VFHGPEERARHADARSAHAREGRVRGGRAALFVNDMTKPVLFVRGSPTSPERRDRVQGPCPRASPAGTRVSNIVVRPGVVDPRSQAPLTNRSDAGRDPELDVSEACRTSPRLLFPLCSAKTFQKVAAGRAVRHPAPTREACGKRAARDRRARQRARREGRPPAPRLGFRCRDGVPQRTPWPPWTRATASTAVTRRRRGPLPGERLSASSRATTACRHGVRRSKRRSWAAFLTTPG
jgi:hypothetical protein